MTNGHLDLIHRSAALFDEVIVAILSNTDKAPMFTVEERVEMLEKRPVEKPKPPAAPKAQAPAPAKRYHEVKKGETITSIAKRYGMSAEELRRINNLSPKAILSVGQKLVVTPEKKS